MDFVMEDWRNNFWNFFTDPKGWLYSDWTEEKYRQYQILRHIPVVNSYVDYLLDARQLEEYLNRYGMDYTDIHDPRKLSTTQSGDRLITGALNFVSKNVIKLYK